MAIFLKTDKMRKILIDPNFAIEERDIKDFLGEFGPFNGQYIARYPSDWKKRLVKHVDELQLKPVNYQAILDRIRNEADLCSFPVAWQWEAENSWIKNAEIILDNHPNAIVVGDALDPTPFVNWIDALDEIRESRRRSWPFNSSISAYEDSCLPLLLNSPAAYLIDPHLDPFSNMVENLLRSLLSKAKGSSCYAFDLIIAPDSCGATNRPKNDPTRMTESEIETLFRRTYADVVPKDRTLRLHLVFKSKFGINGELDLHDRFFLTKHGSISFGRGYSFQRFEDQKTKLINAFVTDKAHHLQLKRTYIDGVARHAEGLPKVAGVAYPHRVSTLTIHPVT